MQKSVLVLKFLFLVTFTSAQTFHSNIMSKYSAQFERIDFFDDEGKPVVSLAPKFYKHHVLKKRIKPIKVGGQSYFIRLGKNGMQSVYDDSGRHVANMERNGAEIVINQNAVTTYYLKPIVGIINSSVLKCKNSEGALISQITFNNNRRLEYKTFEKNDPNLLLMSLCIHKYQELLLGDRGRMVATNLIMNLQK